MSDMSDHAFKWFCLGAVGTAAALVIMALVCPPDNYHARACRAELKLAPAPRDTLAIVLRDDACAKWVRAPHEETPK